MLFYITGKMLALFSKEAVIADEDLNSIVLGILVATAGWTALYTLLCLYNSSNTYEWNCRLVSTVHALVAIGMTSWSGFAQGPWPFTEPGYCFHNLIFKFKFNHFIQ